MFQQMQAMAQKQVHIHFFTIIVVLFIVYKLFLDLLFCPRSNRSSIILSQHLCTLMISLLFEQVIPEFVVNIIFGAFRCTSRELRSFREILG